MGLFDSFNSVFGVGFPKWYDSEEQVRVNLHMVLAGKDKQWSKRGDRERQADLTRLYERFMDRIEFFLMGLMGGPAFLKDFGYRLSVQNVPSEVKKKGLSLMSGNSGENGSIHTNECPHRYKILSTILFTECGSSTRHANSRLKEIWREFLKKECGLSV